jgi:hypothetical protein
MPTQQENMSSFLEKLLKLIPTEIILVYATIVSFIPDSLGPHMAIASVLFILTPLYLIYALGVNNRAQIIISTLSFLVWVFYLGGPFAYFPWYESWIAGTILIIYSLIPPMIISKKPGLGGIEMNPPILMQRASRLDDREPEAPVFDEPSLDPDELENLYFEDEELVIANNQEVKSWREI